MAFANFIPAAGQEYGATVDEDNGAENWTNQVAAGEIRHVEAKPVLDHLAIEDDGDGEEEADPESGTEYLGVTGVTPAVSAVVSMVHRRVVVLGLRLVMVAVFGVVHDGFLGGCRCSPFKIPIGVYVSSGW